MARQRPVLGAVYMHDPALPGCNEAWDRFDVLKIAISCGTCLSKIVS